MCLRVLGFAWIGPPGHASNATKPARGFCGAKAARQEAELARKTFQAVALGAQLIGQNPPHDLVGAVTLKKTVRRPALPLNRLPELLERIEAYKGRELTCLAMKLSLHVFVRSQSAGACFAV